MTSGRVIAVKMESRSGGEEGDQSFPPLLLSCRVAPLLVNVKT
jgi:hypothetical protein